MIANHARIAGVAVLSVLWVTLAGGQPRSIDTAKSVMTVHVTKAGLLSAFGHDHEISAPLAAGTVDVAGRKVELNVNAGSLRVQDPKASGKDRAEIQSTMLGAEVLDAARYKEILFRSTGAAPAGTSAWKVSGDLTLHGATHPVSLQVRESGGHYVGNCRLNITDFGIKPVTAAGGAVRVNEELRIEFDIQLTGGEGR